uniref:Uncharacterized protein n=1 Tax=Caenorhabditis japonica TaxID=281687 RepID=A0A8R1DWE4_CAEJA
MYTNQSAEELEEVKCTSDAVFKVQKSIWMKVNFVFTFLIIISTFVMSVMAAKILKLRNVFSNGTRFLLMVTLLNANINQASMFEIRLRHLYRVLMYSDDACKISFHSPDCAYDQSIFAFTTNLSTLLVCALTFDRIRNSVYDAKIRYASYENLITTKAICSIISAQFVSLSFTTGAGLVMTTSTIVISFSVSLIQLYEAEMSDEAFHISVQYAIKRSVSHLKPLTIRCFILTYTLSGKD